MSTVSPSCTLHGDGSCSQRPGCESICQSWGSADCLTGGMHGALDATLPIPAAPAIKPLEETLNAFDRHATHHVFAGPRYKMHYSQMGDGEPLILVQGICSSRRFMAPVLVELAEHFRVICYDLPGVVDGDGAKIRRYRHEDYPADLLSLADHLGLEKFLPIGFSTGASFVMKAMHRLPDRIERAMLISGFAHRPMSGMEKLTFNMFRYWPGKLRSVPFMLKFGRHNHGRELDYYDAAFTDFYLHHMGEIPTHTACAQILTVDQTDCRQIAEKLPQKVMVVHGLEDRLVRVDHASLLAQLIPNTSVMLIDRCGHFPHLTHPGLLARAARRFFRDA